MTVQLAVGGTVCRGGPVDVQTVDCTNFCPLLSQATAGPVSVSELFIQSRS
jgi:hypothetical protein